MHDSFYVHCQSDGSEYLLDVCSESASHSSAEEPDVEVGENSERENGYSVSDRGIGPSSSREGSHHAGPPGSVPLRDTHHIPGSFFGAQSDHTFHTNTEFGGTSRYDPSQ